MAALVDLRKLILFAGTLFLLASCAGKKEMRPPPPELDIAQCRLVSNGEFAGVRFRMVGVETFNPEAKEAYLISESTGGLAVWQTLTIMRSPAWRTASAQIRNNVAKLIESGRFDDAVALLGRGVGRVGPAVLGQE